MIPDAPASRRVGAIVLAAGASRRLGQPKQLVSVQGKPLLVRTVETLLAVPEVWPVVVVLGAATAEIRPAIVRYPVLITENSAWAEGMASSLRVGITTLRQFSRHHDAALITLCDQPQLSPSIIQRLLAAPFPNASAVVAAHYEGHFGAPALIGRAHFGALSQLTGDQGARQLFSTLPPDTLHAIVCPELAEDLDTPEDLARLRQRQS